MKSGMLIVMVLAMSVVALTQNTQETKSGPSAQVTQTQIVELHVNAKTEPLIL